MTHRGPFQPLPFCDSVKLHGQWSRPRSGGILPSLPEISLEEILMHLFLESPS